MSAAPVRSLSRTIVMGWGAGTLTPVIVFTVTNVLLLRFLTDDFDMAAGVAAALIGFSKIYDAFADPIMGRISDHTRSRWGRRRPYLLAGAVLSAASLFVLFVPPVIRSEAARVIYVATALIFFATAYSMFNVPYMAMPAEMTTDYHERSKLMAYRVVAVGVSTIVASSLGPLVVDEAGGGRSGHAVMAAVLAPFVLLAGVICFVTTADAPATTHRRSQQSLKQQVRSAVANRPFVILLGAKFLLLMALAIQGGIFAYFCTRILRVSYLYLGGFFLCSSLAMIASQPFWLALARRIDKRETFIAALLLAVPVSLSWYWGAPGQPTALIFIRGAATGFMAGGALLMGQSLLPDTIEYDYLKTGIRREGIFAGFYTTMEKFSGAIGIALAGALLGAAGYVQSQGTEVAQPAAALLVIRLLVSVAPALLGAAAAACLLYYRLSSADLAALRARSAATPQP